MQVILNARLIINTKTRDLSHELDFVLPLSLAKIRIFLILEKIPFSSFGEIFFTSAFFSFFT